MRYFSSVSLKVKQTSGCYDVLGSDRSAPLLSWRIGEGSGASRGAAGPFRLEASTVVPGPYLRRCPLFTTVNKFKISTGLRGWRARGKEDGESAALLFGQAAPKAMKTGRWVAPRLSCRLPRGGPSSATGPQAAVGCRSRRFPPLAC